MGAMADRYRVVVTERRVYEVLAGSPDEATDVALSDAVEPVQHKLLDVYVEEV